jgi:hypothetical protein
MKALLVFPALPLAVGFLTVFLKIRFALIKDDAKRMDALCKIAGNY